MHGQAYYELEHCGDRLMKLHKPEVADVVHLIAMITERADGVEKLADIRAAALRALAPPHDPTEPPLLEFLRRFVEDKAAEENVVPFNRESRS